jgi:hypothetical protein
MTPNPTREKKQYMTAFLLSECQGKELVLRIKANWTDEGSKKLIHDFFLLSKVAQKSTACRPRR